MKCFLNQLYPWPCSEMQVQLLGASLHCVFVLLKFVLSMRLLQAMKGALALVDMTCLWAFRKRQSLRPQVHSRQSVNDVFCLSQFL